jgi:hypothetical protein
MDELKEIKGIPSYTTLDTEVGFNYMTFDLKGENLTKVLRKWENGFPFNVSQNFHLTSSPIGRPSHCRSTIVHHPASP